MRGEDDEAGERMKSLRRISLPARALLVAVAFAVLIAVHGSIWYLMVSHLTVSGAVVSGVIALMVVKHLGLLGSASAFLRWRSKR